jgi:chemosensory pili system protein ChpA (sensor histidine kinase/response regulator)
MQAREREAGELAREFDPLEFDRFTRFQELTRMMAESVNDVSTVQQSLIRMVDDTDAALSAQARLNRELQQDLMRVRMVPFGTLAERLHRLVRQTAKELGKRARLELNGASVELDRSVLERVTGPLEHLLRNALTHGIEPVAVRAAAGKPESGEIRLDIRQENNEIVLSLADDGAGLDLEKIRDKALQRGLIDEAEQISEQRIAELIFVPGFSTAEQVTEIAGRGVGMDVVKDEVGGLGGRIELESTPQRGSRFTIRLPLTTAVTQAVLVRSGARICALPAVMIEQVQQLRQEQLAQARAAGHVEWAGRHYPFATMPELLGEPAGTLGEAGRRYSPVLLLRSGAEAAAVQVEEMIGNQEVVVKNLGPQLARVPGVAGVTVLGSGEIVLILNPVALVQRPRPQPAHVTPSQVPVPAAARPKVMVVDDSLTVRKITGRLLEREGYQVLAAKDGVEALEQLAEIVPDVMLVDIEMPRMDGFDLTRNVRADARLKSVPIIVITSRTADKHRAYAKEVGANAFLGKPYQEDELLGHIASFVGR